MGCVESAIEQDRAEQRLVSVGEGGRAVPAAMQFLTPAEDQMLPEAQVPGALGQGSAVDQLGAGFGQRALAKGGELFIQLAREHKLQNGITQEFEPLIGLHRRSVLMRDRGVRQGEPQESGVAEDVAQPGLQVIVSGRVGHGAYRRGERLAFRVVEVLRVRSADRTLPLRGQLRKMGRRERLQRSSAGIQAPGGSGHVRAGRRRRAGPAQAG